MCVAHYNATMKMMRRNGAPSITLDDLTIDHDSNGAVLQVDGDDGNDVVD